MSSFVPKNEEALYPPLENIELGKLNLGFSDEDDSEVRSEIASETKSGNETESCASVHTEVSVRQSPKLAPNLSTLTSGADDEAGGGKEFGNQQANKDAESGKKEVNRDRWNNQLEFLLSCIAMSVGLGNVWRFPFTAYENGGGAFLVPYIIVLLTLGRPMYYLEMCLGQFCSRGPVKVWEIAPIFKGVGYASMIAACCTASFYCSIMAVTVYYFIKSFSDPLPWSAEVCSYPNQLTPALNEICQVQNTSNQSFSELYYFNSVFPQLATIENGIGFPHWKLGVCLLISWVTIFVFLMKGIKSAGKISYFTAIFPYLVLAALLIRGVTLPGAMLGIQYFIKPDWSKLLDAKVWFTATSQCFFSLNVGFGTITFLSSHNPFRHNIYRDALVISITDTVASCLAGLAIFSLLGYLAQTMNVDISQVTRGGPALAFVAFPESIAHLELFPQGFAILFFLMLYTLGVGSALALAGQLITVIRDQFPLWKKWKVALSVCVMGFVSGIVYITPVAMVEVFAVCWIYGVNRFCDDIKFMEGRKPGLYWTGAWKLLPIILFLLITFFFCNYIPLSHQGKTFPTSALVSGWILSGVILSTLPICAVRAICSSPGDTWLEKLRCSLKPQSTWGPKDASEREAWLEMKAIQEIEKIKANTDQLSNASTVPPTSRSSSVSGAVQEK